VILHRERSVIEGQGMLSRNASLTISAGTSTRRLSALKRRLFGCACVRVTATGFVVAYRLPLGRANTVPQAGLCCLETQHSHAKVGTTVKTNETM
jgi:hypothetical protein